MASPGTPARVTAAACTAACPDGVPDGLAPQLVRFCEELRAEGVKVGTAELLDAFHALGQVSWTDREDFRETLAATLAKSQEDRRVFELLFDRFFFRSVEAEAVERGLKETRFEGGSGSTSTTCGARSRTRSGRATTAR